MRVNLTSSSEISSEGRRLDAGYHASDGIKALRHMREWSVSGQRIDPLKHLCAPGGIYIPGRFKRVFVDNEDYGVPYLTGTSITQTDPLVGTKLLSTRFIPQIENLALSERMILVTCSGTIGNAVYVTPIFTRAVGSPDLLRICANPQEILPGYLFAFISSSLGQALIQQKTYGAVVSHIEAYHLYNLPVPRLTKNIERQIHDHVEEATKLRTTADELLTNAQTSLIEQTGLRCLHRQETLLNGLQCFTIPRVQYGKFTMTALEYNPLTRGLVTSIKQTRHKELKYLVQEDGIFYGSRFSRIDAQADLGIKLLSQGHVFQAKPVGRWISRNSVSDYTKYIIPHGAILVAAQGTMGDTEIYGHCRFSHRNFEDVMITEHILRILPDSSQVNPGYLFAFLSSDYGFHLFRSTSCGTKLLGFVLGLVEQIPIPLLSRRQQDQIGDMVYQAYDNRADALSLEEEARRLLMDAVDWCPKQ